MSGLKAGSTIWRWFLRVPPGHRRWLVFGRKNQRVRPGVDSFLGLLSRSGDHVGGEAEAVDDALGALAGGAGDRHPGEELTHRPKVDAGAGALDDQDAARDMARRHEP